MTVDANRVALEFPMKISVSAQSYDTCGGNASISPVGEFLTRYVRAIEPADLVVEVCACFDTRLKPRRTLESMQSDFRLMLGGLPRVTYSPKRNGMDLSFAVDGWLAEDAMHPGGARRDIFAAMCAPIADAMRTAIAGHKKLRTVVAVPALNSALDAALANLPATEDAWQAFLAEEEARAAAEVAPMNPWDLLDIDWSYYHADARQRLDDPLYWDCVDDDAPHGNDTGADVLAMFRAWRKRNKAKPAARFLPWLIKEWGIEDRVAALSHKHLTTWVRNDEITLELIDQAAIALAFAQLKLEATVDAEAAATALASIDRQRDPMVHAQFGWTPRPEREARLRQMQAVLVAAARQAQ